MDANTSSAEVPAPSDKNGEALQEGDIVMVPVLIKRVERVPEFYNVELETVEPMFPGEHKTPILLNAKQVEKPVVVTTENFEQVVHSIKSKKAALLYPSVVTINVSPGDTVIVKAGDPTTDDRATAAVRDAKTGE